LNGRFVVELAHYTDRTEKLFRILDHGKLDAINRTRKIAALFSGVGERIIEHTALKMPLMPGAVEMVVGLRKLGYLVGIVTDSYRIPAEIIRRRVFADFVISHSLKFRGEKATGRITLAPSMLTPKVCRKHNLCKLNVLHHLAQEAGVTADRVLAVGDSENDTCMLAAAGQPVAFNPKSRLVRASAKHVVEGDLRKILRLLGTPIPREPELRAQPYLDEVENE
jgi:glucosyl-3-phosphoglycerate synthase